MVRPERGFEHTKRLAAKLLGFWVTAKALMEAGQVVECNCHFMVAFTPGLALDDQRSLEKRLRFQIATLLYHGVGQIVEVDRYTRIAGVECRLVDGEHAGEDRFGFRVA